jgi:hypothetical protein
MNPIIASDLVHGKMADLQRQADRDQLAAIARDGRRGRVEEAAAQPRWFLRRLLWRLAPAGLAR